MAQSHFNAARRRFLTTLVAGAILHRQRFLNAAETDPRLARVLANTISIDMHSHVGIPFGKPNAAAAAIRSAGGDETDRFLCCHPDL
jgi:hypothetical protein